MKAKRRPIRKANGRFAGSRSTSKLSYSDVYISRAPRRIPNNLEPSQPLYKPASPKYEKRFAVAGIATVTTGSTLAALYIGAGGIGSLLAAGAIVVPIVIAFGATFLVRTPDKNSEKTS